MAEETFKNSEKPERFTPAKVLEAAFTDDKEALAAFRKDLSEMPAWQQIDFARRMTKTASDTTLYPTNFPFIADVPDRTSINGPRYIKGNVEVDATIKTLPDGREILHDLDIVSSKYTNTGHFADARRTDVFTPADGEQFDKDQELKSKMAPYASAYLEMAKTRNRQEPSMLDKDFWFEPDRLNKWYQSCREANKAVTLEIQKNESDPTKQAEMLKEFNRQAHELVTKTFVDVGSQVPGYNRSLKALSNFDSGWAHQMEAWSGATGLPKDLYEMSINVRKW